MIALTFIIAFIIYFIFILAYKAKNEDKEVTLAYFLASAGWALGLGYALSYVILKIFA